MFLFFVCFLPLHSNSKKIVRFLLFLFINNNLFYFSLCVLRLAHFLFFIILFEPLVWMQNTEKHEQAQKGSNFLEWTVAERKTPSRSSCKSWRALNVRMRLCVSQPFNQKQQNNFSHKSLLIFFFALPLRFFMLKQTKTHESTDDFLFVSRMRDISYFSAADLLAVFSILILFARTLMSNFIVEKWKMAWCFTRLLLIWIRWGFRFFSCAVNDRKMYVLRVCASCVYLIRVRRIWFFRTGKLIDWRNPIEFSFLMVDRFKLQ